MTAPSPLLLAIQEVVKRAKGWTHATVPQRRTRASLELMAAVHRLERIERGIAARQQDPDETPAYVKRPALSEPPTEPRMKTIPDHDP